MEPEHGTVAESGEGRAVAERDVLNARQRAQPLEQCLVKAG